MVINVIHTQITLNDIKILFIILLSFFIKPFAQLSWNNEGLGIDPYLVYKCSKDKKKKKESREECIASIRKKNFKKIIYKLTANYFLLLGSSNYQVIVEILLINLTLAFCKMQINLIIKIKGFTSGQNVSLIIKHYNNLCDFRVLHVTPFAIEKILFL